MILLPDIDQLIEPVGVCARMLPRAEGTSSGFAASHGGPTMNRGWPAFNAWNRSFVAREASLVA